MPCDDSRLFDEFHPPLRKFWKLRGSCPQGFSLRPLRKTAGVVLILGPSPESVGKKWRVKRGSCAGSTELGEGGTDGSNRIPWTGESSGN